MEFVTYKQLVDDVREFSYNIGPILGVVGVPRSGMIAASIFAQFNGCRLGSLTSLMSGKLYQTGKGMISRNPRKEILILDDSSYEGAAMKRVHKILSSKSILKRLNHNFKYTYGAIYGSTSTTKLLSYHHRIIDTPRLFEWNWLRHARMSGTMFDMDGVLCENPKNWEDDDRPEEFLQHLLFAKPLHIPHREIMQVVTGRLSKYQDFTERWLKKHGVSYKHLTMCQHPTAKARRLDGGAAVMKGETYRDSTATLFVESCPLEARTIYMVSQKPVLCTFNWKVYK